MIEKDVGFVLKRINFRETSLISTVFTRRFGKVNLILKGFYPSRREFTSSMNIFTLNEFIFYPRQTEIWLSSYVDLVKDYSFLRRDFFRAQVASKFALALLQILPAGEPNLATFDLFSSSLEALEKVSPLKMLYIFFIKFLTLCGVKPQLGYCSRCHFPLGSQLNKQREKSVFFSTASGGLLCSGCVSSEKNIYPLSSDVTSSIFYIQKNDFPALLRIQPSLACERKILGVLDNFLGYHLEFKLADNLNHLFQEAKR